MIIANSFFSVQNVQNLQIDNLDVGKAPTLDNRSDRVRPLFTSAVLSMFALFKL
jgi:hypothetical protein